MRTMRSGRCARWRLLRGDAALILLRAARPDGCKIETLESREDWSNKLVAFTRLAAFYGRIDAWLCARDLSRLYTRGYLDQEEPSGARDSTFNATDLGRRLIGDHPGMLSRGVARAGRRRRFACRGGRWLGCECVRYYYAHHSATGVREIPLPFVVGRLIRFSYESRFSRQPPDT